MEKKQELSFPYSIRVETMMQRFYNSLNEKDRRHYAALEADKLAYGSVSYIAKLLGCDRDTIQSGLDELKKK